MTEVLARLNGVTRRFGAVTALDAAELEVRAGEVLGVLGANGAGKSTLLGVLGGMLRPDEGTVEIGGRGVSLESPRDAWAQGVALVHQDFTLVPTLTVLENLALGRRVGGAATLDLERHADEARALMERTGLTVPLDRRVEDIRVGDRQRAEILKALLRNPRLLVLDEPTAVLAPSETDGLFALLRELAHGGRGIVLVAHKLDEVLRVADRIAVLRGGRTVLQTARSEATEQSLVEAMVGAEPDSGARTEPAPERPLRTGAAPAEPMRTEARGAPLESPHDATTVARLVDVVATRADGGVAVDGVTLSVRRGEVVGIAGVEGNGQHELAQLLSGRLRPDRGSAELPRGIGFIPQDRSIEGTIADFDLTENTALALRREPAMRSGVWLRWGALREAANEIRARHHIEAPDVDTRVGALSGGNQQRVLVGRELRMATDLLVAENPTRGLDVAAAAFVRGEFRRLSAQMPGGPGIVLISTDLDEVLDLADRVFALSRGRLLEVPAAERTRAGVGARMLAGAPRP